MGIVNVNARMTCQWMVALGSPLIHRDASSKASFCCRESSFSHLFFVPFCFRKVDFFCVDWGGSIALWKKEAMGQREKMF